MELGGMLTDVVGKLNQHLGGFSIVDASTRIMDSSFIFLRGGDWNLLDMAKAMTHWTGLRGDGDAAAKMMAEVQASRYVQPLYRDMRDFYNQTGVRLIPIVLLWSLRYIPMKEFFVVTEKLVILFPGIEEKHRQLQEAVIGWLPRL